MSKEDTPFPVDTDADPSSRPWNWRPVGFLVMILEDMAMASRAEATLVGKGFDPNDIKVYTSAEMLANHETYMARRGATSRAVGAMIDDDEARQLYLAYARDERSAMWVRIPTEEGANKALRTLADYDWLHARYYGDEKQQDFHVAD